MVVQISHHSDAQAAERPWGVAVNGVVQYRAEDIRTAGGLVKRIAQAAGVYVTCTIREVG